MKKSILLTAILAFTVPALYFIGCNTKEENQQKKMESAQADVNEAQADLAAAKQEYDQELENFRREMAERSDANNRAIASLKELTDRQKKEAKAAYKARVAELEQKNVELKVRLDEYKGEGKEKWAAFKEEVARDMDELGNAIKDFGKDNVR